jgi:adenylate cyclase
MQRRHLLPALFGVLLVLGLTLLRLVDPYPVAALREIAFDAYQRAQPRESPGWPIRIVDLDEASLTAIGQWPWPRDRLAMLVDRLTEMGAASIAFDALFAEPDRLSPSRIATTIAGVDPATLPDYDAIFARSLALAPSVLGFARSPFAQSLPGPAKAGIAVSGPDPRPSLPLLTGTVMPLPEFAAAASGLGALSLRTEDAVSSVRRLPMLWTDGEAILPGFSLEALRIALGASTYVVLGDVGQPGRVEGVRLGDFTVPTTATGDLWLYYSRPRRDAYIPAYRLLADDYADLAPLIAGHIVLFGTSASGLLDLHATTLGDNVPGVSIHAEAIDQILSGQYLTRTDWVEGLEILLFAFFGLLQVAVVLRLGPRAGLIGVIGLAGLTFASSWYLFSARGVLVDATWSLAAVTLVYAAMAFFRFAITDADKRQIRRAFGYYVAPSLLTEIERSGADLRLGGALRPLTIMFSDVRGFTPLSEKLGPVPLLALLNTLFSALGQNIVQRSGTIDKFMGDAIMAFWNAPVDVPDHPRLACEAALGMRQTLARLNGGDAFGLGTQSSVAIGIGIATGEAVVGNMGLETRFDYSCIGDTVNVASRVEGATKDVGYDIVVVEATHRAVPGFAFLAAGSLQLKGKSRREPIHILVGDAVVASGEAFAELADEHARLVAALTERRDPAIPLARCRLLAPAIEPGLAKFYAVISDRSDDFASPGLPGVPA